MKRSITITVFTAFLFVVTAQPFMAQQPQLALLNPAFERYMEMREQDLWPTTTDEGYALGYIPPPVRFITTDTMQEVDYYDHLGATNFLGYSGTNNVGYAMIKFTPSEDHDIQKLGTFVRIDNTTISYDVYDDFAGGSLSTLLGSIPEQLIARPGYATLDLPAPISVTTGNDIFIKAYYHTPGDDFQIPIEMYNLGVSDPVIHSGVSWISSNAVS